MCGMQQATSPAEGLDLSLFAVCLLRITDAHCR